MRLTRWIGAATALALMASLTACSGGTAAASASTEARTATITVTVKSVNGVHTFQVETAKTEDEQQRGLMYRTDIPKDGGMLFAPYPPSGPPREASFWMKNTPSPLDIIFIRADGSIVHIAENTTPFSESPIPSGEPVAAVLELKGGRAAELGIAEDDLVTWPGGPGR
ncbi:DUF192 domain-containing protein [Sphingomonas sp. 28-62-11]|uniref:DUF192 domain-containing protein n=1 Tax=Sphingomonas sp. 28-62-11 TaxID=1970432 RepID=UPI000BC40447|nr:MAG: hypothetical protein B7Y49_11230 [Sphingomonas sp. 28-62-11]